MKGPVPLSRVQQLERWLGYTLTGWSALVILATVIGSKSLILVSGAGIVATVGLVVVTQRIVVRACANRPNINIR